MSSNVCTCFSGKSPLGLPDCVPSFGKDTVLIMMDERASDGTYNEIALTDLVDGKLPEAFVTGKLNEDDQTKKWFQTAPFDLVDTVRAEPITEEIGGIPMVVRQGNSMWNGTIVAPPSYLKALQTHTCGTNRVFFTVDAAGNLKGKKVLNSSGEMVFRGRKMQKGTAYAMYNEGTKDEKQKIMFSFMVAETENDADFSFLSVNSMSFNFNTLPQIYVTVMTFTEDLTTTTMVISAATQFGSFGEEEHVTGLTEDDFALYNITDESAVTVVSAVEDIDEETYTITYAAQSAGDSMRLSIDASGFYAEPIEGDIPT